MKSKIYKLKFAICAAVGILISAAAFSQVTVNATGGVASATYSSLRLAFNAINAGTHTGIIGIAITANTTETAPCVLNGSGAGAASYTNIGIAPAVDAVSVSGATTFGRGLIELNGADNVIIDGDNPNTAGTNKNLTINNTAGASVQRTSCIRLATSTLVNNCDNVTIRNLIISGAGGGKNTPAYLTEVSSMGVIASGAASTVSATNAPSTLPTPSTLVPAGQTFTSLTVSNNTILKVTRGISVNGSSTTVAPGLMVTNNLIGNPIIGDIDQVTVLGITVQGTNNGLISGNTVYVEGYVLSRGINLGLISTAGVSGVTIEKNNVAKVYNNNVATKAALGIDISGGSNHIIRNNFVGQIMNSQVSGTGAINPATGIAGIKINAGTGHQVYHNTVHLTGTISGTNGKNLVCAFEMLSTASTGVNVRNNIFSNEILGGNTTLYNTLITSIYLPSGGTSAMNLVLNNNTYFQGTGVNNGIAQVGLTGSAANLYKNAAFNPAATTPSTNLRAITSTLSGTGTNDNASYASSNAAPLISPTDLHASLASSELPNIDQKGAASVGILDDIDGDTRPSVTTTIPDIGADEFSVATCSAANGGTISPTTYSACVGETVLLTSVGATNAAGVTYQWKISSTPGGPYTNVTGGSGATTVSYTTPALVAGTNYYILQTTCSFGPLTGLSNEVSITTNVNPVAGISGATSFCAGGSTLLTGTGSGTYQWFANDSLVVGATSSTYAVTAAGYYNMVVTNGFGCTDSANAPIVVTSNALPSVTASATPATLCSGSTSVLNGSGASTYSWTGGVTDNVSFSPASTLTYTVTGTDGNGCTNTATQLITVNTLPTVTASASPSSLCMGSTSTLTGGGASSYSWTGGVTDNVAFTPASTLTYTVTGTDGNGCTNTTTQTVTVNSLPTITASATPATICSGATTTLMGSGGVSYAWSGGVTDNVAFSPSSTATYTVTGTDGNGCTGTTTQAITVNTTPTVTASATSTSMCAGGSTTLMGGGASTYGWTGGATDNVSFVPVSTTTYTVTGTASNGCTNTATQLITVNALPTITSSALPSTICVGETTTLQGFGGTSYSWTGGVTDNVGFTPSTTATYTVTGTDSNGCTATSTEMVTVNSLPNVTASATPASVCTGGSTVLAGAGASSYTWTGGIIDNVSFVPATTGTYTVTGTDLNGCTNTVIQSVTVNGIPTVTANASSSAVCAGTTATLTGGGASTYVWDNSVTDGVPFTPGSTLTYNVTGTDANGCTNTASTTITVNALPTASFSPFASSVCDNAAAFTLTGGSPAGGTYSGTGVSGGMFDPAVSGGGMFLLTYTYSDVNSCVDTDTATITVDLCSGISTNNLMNVSIYPNPSNGTFRLSVGTIDNSEMTISVIDVQGKEIYNTFENVSTGFTKSIELNEAAKGIYTVRLSTTKGVNYYKLIVQ